MEEELPPGGHEVGRVATVVDRMLEFAVVPSFTRIGYDVRSRLERWAPISRSS